MTLLNNMKGNTKMKKALKELIENAPVKRTGKFVELMLLSNGKYNGFYGKTGFDKMIVLGRNADNDNTWYKIVTEVDECDKFDIYSEDMRKLDCNFNLDIMTLYGVPRIWFSGMYFDIDYTIQLSSLVAKLGKRE